MRAWERKRHAIGIKSNFDLISFLFIYDLCDGIFKFFFVCFFFFPPAGRITSDFVNDFIKARKICNVDAHVSLVSILLSLFSPPIKNNFMWSILSRLTFLSSMTKKKRKQIRKMQKRRVIIFQIQLKEFQKCRDTCQKKLTWNFYTQLSRHSVSSWSNAFSKSSEVSKLHENELKYRLKTRKLF